MTNLPYYATLTRRGFLDIPRSQPAFVATGDLLKKATLLSLVRAVLDSHEGRILDPETRRAIMAEIEGDPRVMMPPFLSITPEEAAAFDNRAGEAYDRNPGLCFVRSSGGAGLLRVARMMGDCCGEFAHLRGYIWKDNPAPAGVIGYLPEIIGRHKPVVPQLECLAAECARLGLPPHKGFGPANLLAGLILAEHRKAGTWVTPPNQWVRTDTFHSHDRLNVGDAGVSGLSYAYWRDDGYEASYVGGLAWGLFTGS